MSNDKKPSVEDEEPSVEDEEPTFEVDNGPAPDPTKLTKLDPEKLKTIDAKLLPLDLFSLLKTPTTWLKWRPKGTKWYNRLPRPRGDWGKVKDEFKERKYALERLEKKKDEECAVTLTTFLTIRSRDPEKSKYKDNLEAACKLYDLVNTFDSFEDTAHVEFLLNKRISIPQAEIDSFTTAEKKSTVPNVKSLAKDHIYFMMYKVLRLREKNFVYSQLMLVHRLDMARMRNRYSNIALAFTTIAASISSVSGGAGGWSSLTAAVGVSAATGLVAASAGIGVVAIGAGVAAMNYGKKADKKRCQRLARYFLSSAKNVAEMVLSHYNHMKLDDATDNTFAIARLPGQSDDDYDKDRKAYIGALENCLNTCIEGLFLIHFASRPSTQKKDGKTVAVGPVFENNPLGDQFELVLTACSDPYRLAFVYPNPVEAKLAVKFYTQMQENTNTWPYISSPAAFETMINETDSQLVSAVRELQLFLALRNAELNERTALRRQKTREEKGKQQRALYKAVRAKQEM